MKIIILMLTTLLLTACHFPISANSDSNSMEQYTAAINSWQGAHVDEIFATWPRSWYIGPTTLDDGSTVHAFIWREEYFRQAEQYYDHAHNEWVDKTGAGMEVLICETKFITDSQGVITDTSPGSYQCGQTAPPRPRPR